MELPACLSGAVCSRRSGLGGHCCLCALLAVTGRCTARGHGQQGGSSEETILGHGRRRYGSFSYVEAVLDPVLDALSAVVTPWTTVHFALQVRSSFLLTVAGAAAGLQQSKAGVWRKPCRGR